MIIVAGGDSFVYGSELSDTNKTFTALLSKEHDYHCVAHPGNSNDAISRQTVSACYKLNPDFVIISWTFPGRYEFRFTYDTQQRTGHWYSINSWTIESNLSNIEKEMAISDLGGVPEWICQTGFLNFSSSLWS